MVQAGEALLLMPGDGELGDNIGDKESLTIAGTARVTLTRGSTTLQQVFAAR